MKKKVIAPLCLILLALPLMSCTQEGMTKNDGKAIKRAEANTLVTAIKEKEATMTPTKLHSETVLSSHHEGVSTVTANGSTDYIKGEYYHALETSHCHYEATATSSSSDQDFTIESFIFKKDGKFYYA
jgi:hypothetical protein